MSTPTRTLAERVIEVACRAPSVHNTQPWRWRLRDDGSVDLWADRDRQLVVADPDGRNLAISCGAALHHVSVGGHAMGMEPTVELTPDPDQRDLLATVRFTPGSIAADAADTLDAIDRRCTDRRRFTSWPVPETRLAHLAQAAIGWGAYALPILDVSARFRTELLLTRALTAQESDHRYAREQQAWTDRSSVDGVPHPNATPHTQAAPGQHLNRFASGPPDDVSRTLVRSSDGLMAICTATDDQSAWLQAGQVLSALWLRATRDGLSLVPLSQVVEMTETREALHHDVFAGMAHPQILLRIGWQEIARASLSRTPRRPLGDVLVT